jgi:hypothetical protein
MVVVLVLMLVSRLALSLALARRKIERGAPPQWTIDGVDVNHVKSEHFRGSWVRSKGGSSHAC